MSVTQRLWKTGIGLGLALAAAACGDSAATLPSSSTPPLQAGDSARSQDRSGLLGSWRLVSVNEAGKPPVVVAEPERFTAEFGASGRVSLRADCNRCAGGYTAGSDSLTVGPMACTRAYCAASAPVDTTFAMLVSQAAAWTATDARLELRSASGTLLLRR